ncbi:ADP-ribose pyrophosphatase [Phycisphaerales bacterium]|nr:ADP-ribose pyrophosphatase [Phycisphaerales bacterium]
MLGDTNFRPTVHRQVLHKGAKFDFERLTLTGPGGPPISRECVRHPGAVIVLPFLENPDRVVLIRNWRLSLETYIWELPAGTLGRGEAPAHCAARELREETGYQAATLRPLSRFYTSPGLSDEVMWAFVATGLRPGPQALEPDERVTVHPTPLDEVLGMMKQGDLVDAKSMLVILLALKEGSFGPQHPGRSAVQ